jgi:hypothetical protein
VQSLTAPEVRVHAVQRLLKKREHNDQRIRTSRRCENPRLPVDNRESRVFVASLLLLVRPTPVLLLGVLTGQARRNGRDPELLHVRHLQSAGELRRSWA